MQQQQQQQQNWSTNFIVEKKGIYIKLEIRVIV